ncbi:MAG: hypothetical protein DCC52_01580 [Chloroflexi bacterium]|nr:MAG: hypothetical protein DCC52_01580 [Chloroflexota bacterium]
MRFFNRFWAWLVLALILLLAAYFRWTGLAWDNGYLFHPDERQIALIISKLQPPDTLAAFFSPDSSLNPKFFAYGSLPIYLLRALIPFAPPTQIVGPWADDQLARGILFGRWLSGLFDLGTIVLTFLLGRRAYSARVGLFAAACVAFTALHIQLAHFYAVDTLLTFFVMATLYAAFRLAETENARDARNWRALCGILFGLRARGWAKFGAACDDPFCKALALRCWYFSLRSRTRRWIGTHSAAMCCAKRSSRAAGWITRTRVNLLARCPSSIKLHKVQFGGWVCRWGFTRGAARRCL